MSKDRRSLHLTIEANTPSDLQMLLKQALYELAKHLPPQPDTEIEKKNAHSLGVWLATQSNDPQTHVGQTAGTLGSYSFEFVRGPADYAELEQGLLKQGYRREVEKRDDAYGFSQEDYVVYRHDTLGAKEITGIPAAVVDYQPPTGK